MDYSLRFLKRLETDWDFKAPINVEVQTLRMKASFLKSIFNCSGKWQIENGDLKALLARAQIQFQDAYQALPLLWFDLIRVPPKEDSRAPGDLDGRISVALGKFELIKQGIREVYYILTNPSRSIAVMTDEAHVREILESLLENTKDLLNSKAHSIIPVKKELEAVEKSLRFLRCFLGFTAKRGGDVLGKQKELLTHVEAAACNIACLLYLCSVNNKMDDHEENQMKLELEVELEKIKPSQSEIREIYTKALKAAAESSQPDTPTVNEFALGVLDSLLDNMIELSENKLSFMTSVKDKILALHQELGSLKYYTMDPLWTDSEHIVHDQQFNDLCKHTNSLTSETGYVIFLLYDAEKNEDMARELKAALSHLLAKVEVAKADARKAYDKLVPKPLRSNFPRTNFQGFISSLLQNLEDLVKYSKADSVAPVMHDMEAVQKELLCLGDDFSKIAKIPREHEELNHQWTRCIDIAYQAEYVIDSFVARGCPLWNFKLGLFDVIEEIKMIRKELKNVKSRMINDDPSVQEVPNFPSQVSSEPDSPPNDVLLSSSDSASNRRMNPTPGLVAFEDEAERILEQLTIGEEELQIVSIVGLPGIGKTTLADSVFDHPSVTFRFHVRARICVSQVYQRRRLLLEILQQVTGETQKFVAEDDYYLEEALKKSLKGRRYLIFMDDIWNIGPWLDIKASLPDDNNSSRIMFTSRFHKIASQAEQKSIIYHLDLLSDKKGWQMLRFKLFEEEESCPAELLEVGQAIAKSCKGLPFTIDLIAGVLRMIEREEYRWRQVAKNIMTHIADDPQRRSQKTLELSYSHLPDHLKPCFLYFGEFPQDTEVPAKMLIWLWIAEGFVQPQKVGKSIENEAEAYLNDLIARSLVTVSKRRSFGGVKASRIHDLLHDFACTKAKEEFFLLQMEGQANLSSVSSYDYTDEGYRLCSYPQDWTKLDASGPSCSGVRSLLYSSSRVRSLLYSANYVPFGVRKSLSLIINRFRLLRVLYIQGIDRHYFHPNLRHLVHLKFMALPAMQSWILSLIPGFQNLETLLLVGSPRRIIAVDNIWNLSRLRHFHVGYCNLGRLSRKILTECFQFANLLTLSTPCLLCDEETERKMRRLPNLRKLSCTVLDSWDCTENCNLFPKLDFLKQLESLKMIYVGKVLHPVGKFSFPPFLQKLTLSEFRLPWSEISTIGTLEHLEVLKLRNRAFEGEIWDMRDGEFSKLKVLSMYNLDIEQWNAMEHHLRLLERLEVLDCKNLVELPSCLENVQTLKVIRLWRCSSSTNISAEKIVEEQKEVGNEALEINLDPPAKTDRRERAKFVSLL